MEIEGFLQESNRLWRFLVENTRDLICITDLAGVIRYATPSHLGVLGYQPQELVGESFFLLVYPDDLEMALSTFAQGVGERIVMRTTGRYRHRDGHPLWMEATGMPLVEDGELLGGIVISRDVTGHVEAEDFLRIQRDLALKLAQSTDLENTLSLSLEAVLEATGFDAGGVYLVNEETGGLDLACSRGLSDGFVAAVYRFDSDSPNARLVLAGECIYTEYEEMDLPIDDIWHREGLKAIAVVPVVHQGKVIGDVNIASHSLVDVPDKVRATVETMAGQIGQAIARVSLDSALRESEAGYRAVFEATGTAMCVIDSEGSIVFTNQEFENLSGHRLEDVKGVLRLGDLVAHGGEEAVIRCLWGPEGDCDECPQGDLSLKLACAGGEAKEVIASMGLLPGRNAAVLSLIDVTREREYERELEERARQLADFLGIASHEIRHPITLIRGYTETMLEAWRDGQGKELEEVLLAVEASSYRLMHLVEELLDISRIEEGRFPVQRMPAHLEPALREAVEEIGGRYTDWAFTVEMGADIPVLPVDVERIRQLMVILLENAAHFSPEGSVVEVKAEKAEDVVRVSVQDRGVGVPASERGKIFERFYQVEDFNHHSVPGLGMGLFIAASIVEAHGGRIWCEERPGGGSLFRFTLPYIG